MAQHLSSKVNLQSPVKIFSISIWKQYMQCYCFLSWQKTTCNLIGSLVTMICSWPINAGLTFVWDVHHSPHQPATLVDQRNQIWQCSGRQCWKTQPGTHTMQIKSKLKQKNCKIQRNIEYCHQYYQVHASMLTHRWVLRKYILWKNWKSY